MTFDSNFKVILKKPVLIASSIIIGLILSSILYFGFFKHVKSDSYSIESIFTLLNIIIFVLITVLLNIIGILINRIYKDKHSINSLNNFKEYIDTLYQLDKEVHIYEILCNYLHNLIYINQYSLMYRSSIEETSQDWTVITNSDDKLCKLSPKTCPLIKSGRVCYVNDINEDTTCFYQNPDYKFGSYICLPILDEGYSQSILQLYSQKNGSFTDHALSEIGSYIEMAKVVIRSKRTLTSLSKKATTDKLTKVYNRSYLDSYLDSQVEEMKITKQPLSLIISDVDHFKRINDTYGHIAGDFILKLFADQLLKHIRKTDVVSRFGGDEFFIILPDTDIETASLLAERIRAAVEEIKIPRVNEVQLPNITCSLGVSSMSICGNTKDNLIKTADDALYLAKQAGRNCVRTYKK